MINNDGVNVIADYDGANHLKATYLTPFLDQNILVTRAERRGARTYYYLQDGLGSVRNLIDARQRVRNRYDYYAFGESLNWSETIPNRYTYTSREWDSESANYYYRARYYTPTNGRFIARDQIEYESGLNLYTYVQNDPINITDPYGLQGTGDDCCYEKRRHYNRFYSGDFDKCVNNLKTLSLQKTVARAGFLGRIAIGWLPGKIIVGWGGAVYAGALDITCRAECNKWECVKWGPQVWKALTISVPSPYGMVSCSDIDLGYWECPSIYYNPN